QGENALGLVRAFFHAGARSVLASPWPLVDSEARALIDELSSRLGSGQTLEAALAGAKRARRRAGDPTMAWAGLQLHGAASSVLAHPAPARRVARFLGAAVIVTVLTGVLATLARRRALRARQQSG